MNKEVIKWLNSCPEIQRLYPLFGTIEDGAKHISRLPDGEYQKRHVYVDGEAMVYNYADFLINCFDSAAFNYQSAESSENLTEYASAQAICDWIAETETYPQITGGTVIKVEPLPRNPQIAGVDKEGIAKYVVGLRIYLDGKVVKCLTV